MAHALAPLHMGVLDKNQSFFKKYIEVEQYFYKHNSSIEGIYPTKVD